MAQYEASEEQIKQITDDSTGLSYEVKEAISKIASEGKSVSVLGSQSGESVTGAVTEQAVVASGAALSDVNLTNATAFVADSASGNVTASTQQAVTADLVNSSVELNITNNADNTVNISGANGGGLTAGDGNNNVTVTDGANVSVTLGAGDNNVNVTGAQGVSGLNIETGSGNNTMSIGNAESSGKFQMSVTTGDGNDDIGLSGNVEGQITSGAGDLTLTMDGSAQENANVSVDAGDGFDLIQLIGKMVKHAFEFVNGHFRMHSANVQIDNVNVIGTDMDGDSQITNADHITVLATTEEDSLIAKLYKVALGREAIDGEDGWGDNVLGGYNWWSNEYEKTNDINDHEQLVRAFLNCDEFHNTYDAMTDTEYVNTLFNNLGASNIDAANEYIAALKNGTLDREEVAWKIATSEQAVQVLGTDGEQYVIDGFTTDDNA